MERLFNVTKPSFFDRFGLLEKIEILLVVGTLAGLLGSLALLPLALIGRFALPKHKNLLAALGMLLPAAVAASLALILLDNFTYVIFKLGVVTSEGIFRALYALVFLVLILVALSSLLDTSRGLTQKFAAGPSTRKASLISVLAMLGCAAVLLGVAYSASYNPSTALVSQAASSRPNILYITSDGLSASNVSAYGYARETTPNLKQLAETSLVLENAYSNSANTSGSLISFLTSKYVTNTRVLYPPDILLGTDAYQHLPGMLHDLGYRSYQLTTPHYGDAAALNLLKSFDISNGRTLGQSSGLQSWINERLPQKYAYFTNDLLARIGDRLQHIFFIKSMQNAYALVQDPVQYDDKTRLTSMVGVFIESHDQPFFIQTHFMMTHGPTYHTIARVFTKGRAVSAQKPLDNDFYDDSILEFDKYLGILIDELKTQGLYDNTIIVVTSDHGRAWNPLLRVPLLIHFPGDQHKGRISANAQVIDITPTVLDFMGVPKPAWMEGQSLIKGQLPNRPIFSAFANVENFTTDAEGQTSSDVQLLKPPFYQFGAISMIYCDKYYKLKLTDFSLDFGQVGGSTAQCAASEQISQEKAIELISGHLKQHGFDIAQLQSKYPYLAGK